MEISFENIKKVSTGLKTTDIKGKQYVQVNERVKAFRELIPGGTIRTEMISLTDGMVVFKATLLDEDGKVLADGHAYEREGATNINKTSFIENCETSAVGRALAFLGIGIDLSIASAEEVENAIEQQTTDLPISDIMATTIKNMAEAKNVPLAKITERYHVNTVQELKAKDFRAIMEGLKKS